MTYNTEGEGGGGKNNGGKSRGRKYVIAGVVLLFLATLATSVAFLVVFLSRESTEDVLKLRSALYNRQNDVFSVEVGLDRQRALEAVHYIPHDQKTETFVVYDYKARKVVLRLMDDMTCYIRDMQPSMTEEEIDGVQKSYETEKNTALRIGKVENQYYQALNVPVDTSVLSEAILEFCSGLKLQYLQLMSKDDNPTSTHHNSRRKRGIFDDFMAYANQRFAGIRAALGAFQNTKPKGSDVGVLSVDGALPDVLPDKTIPVAGTFSGEDESGTSGGFGLFDAFRRHVKKTLKNVRGRMASRRRQKSNGGGDVGVLGGTLPQGSGGAKPGETDVGSFGGVLPDGPVLLGGHDDPVPGLPDPYAPDGGKSDAGVLNVDAPGGTPKEGTDVSAFGGVSPDAPPVNPLPKVPKSDPFPRKTPGSSRNSPRRVSCTRKVQCTFQELGCTVRRERFCPNPSWADASECDDWQYTDVKACANVRRCQTSCI
ncbi:uncharacterized protein LOC106155157 [Lingula anatina]|uniref:Uncharacterized protein LOC106155157 n=1 Tax=Lingula anatina TaxID=7574 RepID=A0A1S3HGW7_LINAN|nr:uncharacterized protein LOC106155157 [Lingula anatina]|eukprot:XP_013385292.1 uncharacterized protein LOC106155157 [Lingula anatina]